MLTLKCTLLLSMTIGRSLLLDKHAFAINRADWRTDQDGALQTFTPSQTASTERDEQFVITSRLSSTTGTASQITLDTEDDYIRTTILPGKVIAGLTGYGGTTPQGLRIARWHFYEGSDLGGSADLYIAQSLSNVAGLFIHWNPSGVSGLASRAMVAQVTASVYLEGVR